MDNACLPEPARKPFLERNYERATFVAVAIGEALVRRTSAGRKVYFDPGDLPWLPALEGEWRAAREELDSVLRERERIPAFQEVSHEQSTITRDQGWKVFVFRVFGRPVERNCARCPRTAELLARIPGLRNAMFSILAPGKEIPPHRGVYAGLLRYHLALKVPARALDCHISVDGHKRHWREGASLVFDDSFVHSVRNDTPEERVVLFADFVRPLPWPLSMLNRAVLAMLGRTALFRDPLERFERGDF